MTWKFKPSEAKTIDLADASPGDFLCPLRPAAKPDLWLKLGGTAQGVPVLSLTGENPMVVWEVQARGRVPTLKVATGSELELEIPEDQKIGQFDGKVGELIFTDSGAHLVALAQERGFTEQCLVSLATWQAVGLHEVGNIRVSFSTWRLANNTNLKERQVLLSFGNWQ